MSKCGVCDHKVSRYDDSIICAYDVCGEAFHIACVDITVHELQRLKSSEEIKQWLCKTCESKHNLSRTVTGSDNDQWAVATNTADATLSNVISETVKQAVSQITKEIVSLLKIEIDKLHINNCNLAEEVGNLKNQITKLSAENCNLNKEICVLKESIKYSKGDGDSNSQTLKNKNVSRNTEQKAANTGETKEIQKKNTRTQKDTEQTKSDVNYANVLKNPGSNSPVVGKKRENATREKETESGIRNGPSDSSIVTGRDRSKKKNKSITGAV